ncbi:MAG: HIT family protein [Gemmatimonas sp.]
MIQQRWLPVVFVFMCTSLLAQACRSAPSVVANHGASDRVSTTATAFGDNSGLFGTYDNNNAFARIIRGELPASKVYEDEHVLAFMPLRMITPGHVLVISKTSRARNLLEIEPDELARVMDVATRVARAEVKALGIQGFQILQNNGAVGTQSVFHLHVHVLPRYPGVDLRAGAGPADDRKVLDEMARKIKAAMK